MIESKNDYGIQLHRDSGESAVCEICEGDGMGMLLRIEICIPTGSYNAEAIACGV